MELLVPASEAMVSEKEIKPSVVVSYATAREAEALGQVEIIVPTVDLLSRF